MFEPPAVEGLTESNSMAFAVGRSVSAPGAQRAVALVGMNEKDAIDFIDGHLASILAGELIITYQSMGGPIVINSRTAPHCSLCRAWKSKKLANSGDPVLKVLFCQGQWNGKRVKTLCSFDGKGGLAAELWTKYGAREVVLRKTVAAEKVAGARAAGFDAKRMQLREIAVAGGVHAPLVRQPALRRRRLTPAEAAAAQTTRSDENIDAAAAAFTNAGGRNGHARGGGSSVSSVHSLNADSVRSCDEKAIASSPKFAKFVNNNFCKYYKGLKK